MQQKPNFPDVGGLNIGNNLDCRIDPGFPDFNDYCREKGFPVTIISR